MEHTFVIIAASLVVSSKWNFFYIHMHISRGGAENLRKIRWLFCRRERDEWRLPRGWIHSTPEDRWQGEPVIPCGQYAQKAGCHDREHRKHNKVLGQRPPHTKRRFFVKKKILGNKRKQSCSVPFSTASTVCKWSEKMFPSQASIFWCVRCWPVAVFIILW